MCLGAKKAPKHHDNEPKIVTLTRKKKKGLQPREQNSTSKRITNRPQAYTQRTGHKRAHNEPATGRTNRPVNDRTHWPRAYTRRPGHERTHADLIVCMYVCMCVCVHVYICMCKANKKDKVIAENEQKQGRNKQQQIKQNNQSSKQASKQTNNVTNNNQRTCITSGLSLRSHKYVLLSGSLH